MARPVQLTTAGDGAELTASDAVITVKIDAARTDGDLTQVLSRHDVTLAGAP